MALQRSGNEGEDDGDKDHHHASEPRERTPSSGWKPPVGEQQDHVDPQQPHWRHPGSLGEGVERHRGRYRTGRRTLVSVGRVFQGEGHPEQSRYQADPTYSVSWTPRSHQGSDDGEGEERNVHQQIANAADGVLVTRGLRNLDEHKQCDAPDEHGHREAGERPGEPDSDPTPHSGDSWLIDSLLVRIDTLDTSLREDRLSSVTKATSRTIWYTRGPQYNLLTMNAAEFLPDVRAVLEERDEPSYRIRQVYRALAGSLVRDWEEATNLPKELQAALSAGAPAAALTLERVSEATDGTRKYLFYTRDGHAIETVMIPEKARRTVCISTQVGCPMGCTFCATGLLGIKRNLGALRVLNDPDGFGLAARHIAVSTSGLVEKIRRFADEPEQFHLAISLHTPFEDERREIMPVAARHTIPELMDAARYYVPRTRRKLFFEYTLLPGVNDQPRHVEALTELLDHRLYHLNLLRFNWTDTGFSATSKAEAKRFLGYARELGLSATLRPSRGQDIDAACGQLAGKARRGRPAVHMA